MYDYSIIIPHYNNAHDLARCLASIPQRDDVQVIIVDDNSSPELVDFERFPGLGRKNTKVVFSKGEKGKGPGYARNLGMEKAEGRWIVFADSDDYFLPGFSAALDEYRNDPHDVVFFKCLKQDTQGNQSEYQMFNVLIDESFQKGTCERIPFPLSDRQVHQKGLPDAERDPLPGDHRGRRYPVFVEDSRPSGSICALRCASLLCRGQAGVIDEEYAVADS